MFDYDRDVIQPPEEREELDPSEYVYIGCGQYRYVGDEIQTSQNALKQLVFDFSEQVYKNYRMENKNGNRPQNEE